MVPSKNKRKLLANNQSLERASLRQILGTEKNPTQFLRKIRGVFRTQKIKSDTFLFLQKIIKYCSIIIKKSKKHLEN